MSVSRLRQLAGLALLGMLTLVVAPPVRAQTVCTADSQGVDDEPGQKDLQQFCETLNQACSVNAGSRRLTWNFDDTNWAGNNTGDACVLCDTDSDGNVNRAVCVTVVDGAMIQANNPKCYTCDDDRPTRCTNAALTTCASTCTVSLATEVFPNPPNTTHTMCNGPNCFTQDAQIDCCIESADAGGGAHIDTCSYPSQQPNSDPSDCVAAGRCTRGKIRDVCLTHADCDQPVLNRCRVIVNWALIPDLSLA